MRLQPPTPSLLERLDGHVEAMTSPRGPKLYAVRNHDCWIVCRKRVATAWDALTTANYVGTWLSPEPPKTWEFSPWNVVPVVALSDWKAVA